MSHDAKKYHFNTQLEMKIMKVEQARWEGDNGWRPEKPGQLTHSAQLVLLFGSTRVLRQNALLQEIRRLYPQAHLLGCSTAGEIFGTQVDDETLVLTAVSFEHTPIQVACTRVDEISDSYAIGKHLADSIPHQDLSHVMVFSDGLQVNGSDLACGLTDHLPDDVVVTGGLSGDGGEFKETLVLCDDVLGRGVVSVLGLYGSRIQVGYGSLGGWDPFGPDRVITKSDRNVVYALDGRPALALYKEYLGKHADGLPATSLLFPLSLRNEEGDLGVVRTVLSVDEEKQSMTFAGDLPETYYARLMKASFDRLIEGATGAAQTSCDGAGSSRPDLAILISCVGRKMVLRQRVEEEVEGVQEILGPQAALTGFYSYGELCPRQLNTKCELHNQTMTVTTFQES